MLETTDPIVVPLSLATFAQELDEFVSKVSARRIRLLSKVNSKVAPGPSLDAPPEPSAVTLDDGTTDRQPHAHATGFRSVESVEG